MSSAIMTLFPHLQNQLETMKLPLQGLLECAEMQKRSFSLGFELLQQQQEYMESMSHGFWGLFPFGNPEMMESLSEFYFKNTRTLLEEMEKSLLAPLDQFHRERAGELEFLNFLTEEEQPQDWTVPHEDNQVLLDLPSLKLIDISLPVEHALHNYTVVFAPRAGHHSNIAERVALYLRDQGLTRMAIVEQKCAADIPLMVNGRRHFENFEGQVAQYRTVLEHLKERTGHPAHLVAICQPGPLLMATLILHPHLGKTFGSAGSPMHTEAQKGFLTDFARAVGPGYIDLLLSLFGYKVGPDRPGTGRECYDGRMHVLGFYFMSGDQHFRNLRQLLHDMKSGSRETVERQKIFYRWYNSVNHFPAGFIRDTFQKVFVENALVRGTLSIGDQTVRLEDYPADVPLWALGGSRDDIAPPLQAVGHMDLIPTVPETDKLSLCCDGGHMGLFRSGRILKEYYTRIAAFMLGRSDLV